MNSKLRFSNALVILVMLVSIFNGPFVQPATAAVPQVSLAANNPYTQNFNTLPVTGNAPWTDDGSIPGIFAQRTGTGTTIVADSGTSTSGNLYSYGSAGSTDRALGSLGSGNTAAGNFFYGVRLVNDTTQKVSAISVSYTGEQWRNGGGTGLAQTVTFWYQVGSNLTDLKSASGWTAVPALNFTSPIFSTTAAALNGNDPANRRAISGTINVSLDPGQQIMLRWSDPDHPSSDHGLSIDDLTVAAVFASPISSLDLVQSTDKVNWQPVTGTLAGGFALDLDPAEQWIYFNVDNVVSAEPLGEGRHPFVLDTASLPDPTGYYAYWAAKGVDGTAVPGTPQYTLWQIINGLQPMFYLKVSPGPAYQLLDGYKYLVESTEEFLRVEGSYPQGAYRFLGTVKTGAGQDTVQAVSIDFQSLPQVESLSLRQKTGAGGAWEAVQGSLGEGFKVNLDPGVDYFYLDIGDFISNKPLKEDLHPFVLDTASLPAGFYEYWALKGVDSGDPSGKQPWQVQMWEIINGRAPMFYLKVAAGPTFTLVDGLQHFLGAGDPLVAVNGDYPLGKYRFNGVITDQVGGSSTMPVDITFQVGAKITSLALEQSTDQAAWSPVYGSIAGGFTMDLDPAVEFYYLRASGITSVLPLKEGYHPFFLDVDRLPDPSAFYSYWAGKEVDVNAVPGTWQYVMWQIINGDAPMFYLKVEAGPVYTLVDGLQHLSNQGDQPLRLSGDYPLGLYQFKGQLTSTGDVVIEQSFGMTFEALPAVSGLTLQQSTDTTNWTNTQGSFADGFTMGLDPAFPYYYLRAINVTTNKPLKEMYHPFTLDAASVPADFYTYWAGLGVTAAALPGTWQFVMWQIINGDAPMFYLKVGAGPAYTLVDGLQYLTNQGDQPLRVSGDYPHGTYLFTGVLTDSIDESASQDVAITFGAMPLIADLDLVQSTDQAAWTPVSGTLAGGFNLRLDSAQEYYYFNVENVVVNDPLALGYHPFTLDTTSLPLNFYAYWATRGVTSDPTGKQPWQIQMWEIINGRAPMFYLKAAVGDTYTLVDGLMHQLLQPDEFLAVNGNYPAGPYRFNGVLKSPEGVTSSLQVNIAFTNTICAVPNPTYPLKGISEVQGSGTVSPLVSQKVTVQGQVTGVYLGSNAFNGFFVQDAGDSNAATSDGVFVYASSFASFPLAKGDWVQVSGTVSEYNGLTQLTPPAPSTNPIAFCGSGANIAPTTVTLPFADAAFPERYESMLVTLTQTLTVTETYNLAQFGQILLSNNGRLYNTHNDPAQTRTNENKLSSLTIDDGLSLWDPNPAPYLQGTGEARTLRVGSTTAGVTGNMYYTASLYMVEPTEPLTFDTSVNPRPGTPPVVDGEIKVAGFNLYNYFTTLDNGSYPAGSPYNVDNTPRGATTQQELDRQTAKLVEVIRGTGADVIGVFEVEKWAEAHAAQTLVDAVNAGLAPDSPDRFAVAPDPNNGFGTDYIKQSIFYKPAKVSLVEGGNLSANAPIFDRYPVAQVFQSAANGERFSVVMNHFKSKGGCPTAIEDPLNTDHGQGCWNQKRIDQATALLSWINSTLKPIDPDVLVMGDLNAYGLEDPITTLTTGGLTNEILKRVSDPFDRYSYVYFGESGYLDHSLANASMDLQVKGVTIWHVNADEPAIIDYTTQYKTDDPYTPILYRASDHDPIITGLSLFHNDAPQLDNAISEQSVYWGRAWSFAFAANTFSDPNAAQGDTLSYSATLGDGSPLPSWLSFDSATRTFSGTPPVASVGAINLKVTAADLSGATVSATFTLNVQNHAPTLVTPLADQKATALKEFTFTFAASAFDDADLVFGDSLAFTATLDSGAALPSWLDFNPAARTFSGTPALADVGHVSVKVTATDLYGATVSSVFDLVVFIDYILPVIANNGSFTP